MDRGLPADRLRRACCSRPAAGLDGMAAGIRGRSFTWLQPTAVLGAVLAGLITVAGRGVVGVGRRGRPDRPGAASTPCRPYVRSAMIAPERVRVLALELDGDQVAVLGAGRRPDPAGRRGPRVRLRRLDDRPAADRGRGAAAGRRHRPTPTSRPTLRDLGIGFVWVSGASEEQQSRIDNTPGLGAASGNLEATVWQLQPPVTRETERRAGAAPRRGRRPPLAGRAGRRRTRRRWPPAGSRASGCRAAIRAGSRRRSRLPCAGCCSSRRWSWSWRRCWRRRASGGPRSAIPPSRRAEPPRSGVADCEQP